MKNKENLSLIIGLSLPFLLIIVVLVSVYLPRFFAPDPSYDFVYSVEDNYFYGGSQFFFKADKLEKKVVDKESPMYKDRVLYEGEIAFQEPKLFLFDTSEGKSKEITLEEANELKLSSEKVSEDGFRVVCGKYSEGFIFSIFDSGEDCRRQFVRGHGISTKVDVDILLEDYMHQFYFQGWVITE